MLFYKNKLNAHQNFSFYLVMIIMIMLLLSNHVSFAEEQAAKALETMPTSASQAKSMTMPNADKKVTQTSDSTQQDLASEDNTEKAMVTGNSTPRAQIKILPPPDRFKQQQQDIKYYLKQTNGAEQYQTFTVDDHEYLVFTDQYTGSINKGVIIILPDWQQNIFAQNALGQLRKTLPNKHWTTLTLAPLPQPENYPSSALDTQQANTENETRLNNYQQTLTKVFNQVIAKAQQFPGPIIYLAQGQQNVMLNKLIKDEKIVQPAALIMLSAYSHNQPLQTTLNQCVALSSFPILDIQLQRDNHMVNQHAMARIKVVKNAMKIDYYPKQLANTVIGQYPDKTLPRTIIGWLRRIGW